MMTFAEYGIDLPSNAHGNVKTICPKCSHTRKHSRDRCLSVDVGNGVWNCHNCQWRGSLRSGEDSGNWQPRPPKVYQKPTPISVANLHPAALDWFVSRGISPEAVARHDITGTEGEILFPYVVGGELINVKHRARGKKFWMEAGCELAFWNLDACANAEQVAIFEGELDVLAAETAGLPYCLSVPNGASTGSMDYLDSGRDLFDRCHTVILAVDNDDAGLKLEAELARRIGKEKCYRVRWPDGCKDANEVLEQHGAATISRCIANAEPFPIDGIETASQSVTDLLTLYRIGTQRGTSTGWRSVDALYTIKPGQLTIVTGTPGSGKSEWVDSLMINLAKRDGWAFGVYSPENYPIRLHRSTLAEKYTGKPFYDGPTPRMTEEDVVDFSAWCEDKIIHINPDGPSLDDILTRARSLVIRFGIRGLVIDPWNEVEHTRPRDLTETEYIGQALSKVRQFARDQDIHVWIVAHPRIMRREAGTVPVPTPYDINGSANWFNKSDNCITVWRDKENDTEPVQIHVQKIRFREIGRLGMAILRYDRVTGRYFDIP
jgi:twinkle protein